MAGTTPNLGLPYPSPPDPADVPADMQALAMKLDGILATNAMSKLWDSRDAGVTFPATAFATPTLDPTKFRHVLAVWKARTDGAYAEGHVGLRFNGLGGQAYNDQQVAGSGATAGASESYAQNMARIGNVPGANTAANYYGAGMFLIPDCGDVQVAGYTMLFAVVGTWMGGASGSARVSAWTAMYGDYFPLAALTFAVWGAGAGNFVGATRMTVYGLA